jgi:hypothetical protein
MSLDSNDKEIVISYSEVCEEQEVYDSSSHKKELLGCLPSCAKLGLTILAIATIGYGFYKLQDSETDSSDEIIKLN